MNMTEEQTSILSTLDWASADEEYEPSASTYINLKPGTDISG
jgi:hypothetical protein